MKRNVVFVTVMLFLCVYVYAQNQLTEADAQDLALVRYTNIINALLGNFNNIIAGNRASENVYETYAVSDNAVRSNLVGIKIDQKLDQILSGMYFSFNDSGEYSLVFGTRFLDTYSVNSSIHYSILIHEYRHLHDYLKNTEAFTFAKTGGDFKEEYWYELDALWVEAEFIKFYLAGNYELSRFEEYLLVSFDNNNLNDGSIFVLKESMDIFFYFNDLEEKFAAGGITPAEIIPELDQNGESLLSRYKASEGEFLTYVHFIEISTFAKYLTRTLTIIINEPTLTWDELFTRYPKTGQIYHEMSAILEADSVAHSEYLASIYRFWEDDVVENLKISAADLMRHFYLCLFLQIS